MADTNEQTGPNPGTTEDLFDFPVVGGLEEFGLVPPGTTPAPSAASAAPAADVEMSPTRPSAPVPADVADLDEDLFEFDEVFDLAEDPFHNGTLEASCQPTRPEPAPAPARTAFLPEEHVIDGAALEQAPATARTESPAAPARPEPTVEAALAPEAVTTEPQGSSPQPDLEDLAADPALVYARTTADRGHGPRPQLPDEVAGSLTGNNGRLIAVLGACFLMVNTGIFFLAQQATSNVNESLSQATGLIADAIATRGQGEATLRGAQPPQFGPGVTHQFESLQPGLGEAVEKEAWIDPRDYRNPHEFAVGNAKKMMEEGRFEEARRLLYWVLANQQRAPLTPSMRAEIDYLIPLTYYQQGRTTGLEQEDQ